MPDLDWLNTLPSKEAEAAFLKCCRSRRWAAAMRAARPFTDSAHLREVAKVQWFSLGEEDWLQAFAGHPKIGDRESLAKKFAATHAWSAQEQAGAAGADEAVLEALAEANRQYEAQNGFIFIVCASGKSAEGMLDLLEQRLQNDRTTEMKNAADEQHKITLLRLEKLS